MAQCSCHGIWGTWGATGQQNQGPSLFWLFVYCLCGHWCQCGVLGKGVWTVSFSFYTNHEQLCLPRFSKERKPNSKKCSAALFGNPASWVPCPWLSHSQETQVSTWSWATWRHTWKASAMPGVSFLFVFFPLDSSWLFKYVISRSHLFTFDPTPVLFLPAFRLSELWPSRQLWRPVDLVQKLSSYTPRKSIAFLA